MYEVSEEGRERPALGGGAAASLFEIGGVDPEGHGLTGVVTVFV